MNNKNNTFHISIILKLEMHDTKMACIYCATRTIEFMLAISLRWGKLIIDYGVEQFLAERNTIRSRTIAVWGAPVCSCCVRRTCAHHWKWIFSLRCTAIEFATTLMVFFLNIKRAQAQLETCSAMHWVPFKLTQNSADRALYALINVRKYYFNKPPFYAHSHKLHDNRIDRQ